MSRIIRVGPCACRLYRSGVTDDGQPDDVVFRVPDYEGVDVVCSRDQWVNKIVRVHADLDGRDRDVADAIERPAMVLQDRDHTDRKHHMVGTPTGHWLKVVVVYEPGPHASQGRVLTAFHHRRMRRGDSVLYTR